MAPVRPGRKTSQVSSSAGGVGRQCQIVSVSPESCAKARHHHHLAREIQHSGHGTGMVSSGETNQNDSGERRLTKSKQQHAMIASVFVFVVLHCQQQIPYICLATVIVGRRKMTQDLPNQQKQGKIEHRPPIRPSLANKTWTVGIY